MAKAKANQISAWREQQIKAFVRKMEISEQKKIVNILLIQYSFTAVAVLYFKVEILQ